MLTRFLKSLAYHPLAGACMICKPKKVKFSSRSPFTTSFPSRNTKYAKDSANPSTSSSYDASSHTPGSGTPSKEVNTMTQDAKAFDFETLRTRFRELSDRSAVSVRQRADAFTAKTSTTFSKLGSHLNRVTGYEEIEALKLLVAEQEARIKGTRRAAQDARKAYDEAVDRRSNCQREVNDLLQRKQKWSNSDIDRFAAYMREDHLYEQDEMRTKATVAAAEVALDEEFDQLMKTILARYHEEQVWSDKIRSASTYGSLAALALNLVVFILAIVVVEPWKRRRLAQTFEKKIEEMNQESTAMVEAGLKEIGEHLVAQEKLWTKMIETASQKGKNVESTPKVRERAAEAFARVLERAKDQEIVVAFATSAFAAGAVGWLARSWLGH